MPGGPKGEKRPADVMLATYPERQDTPDQGYARMTQAGQAGKLLG